MHMRSKRSLWQNYLGIPIPNIPTMQIATSCSCFSYSWTGMTRVGGLRLEVAGRIGREEEEITTPSRPLHRTKLFPTPALDYGAANVSGMDGIPSDSTSLAE